MHNKGRTVSQRMHNKGRMVSQHMHNKGRTVGQRMHDKECTGDAADSTIQSMSFVLLAVENF